MTRAAALACTQTFTHARTFAPRLRLGDAKQATASRRDEGPAGRGAAARGSGQRDYPMAPLRSTVIERSREGDKKDD